MAEIELKRTQIPPLVNIELLNGEKLVMQIIR